MKLLQILRQHYVATTLLGLGLITLASLSTQTYWPKNLEPKLDNTVQTEKQEIDSASSTAPKNTEPQLHIPEVVPPSPVENSTGTVASQTQSITSPTPLPSAPTDQDSGTFVINGQNYPVTFAHDSNVYTVMKQLNDSGTLKIDFKNYSGLGYFVDGINGLKSDTFRAKYWIYYINGARAQIGISNYFLKSGDIITWKYEAGE